MEFPIKKPLMKNLIGEIWVSKMNSHSAILISSLQFEFKDEKAYKAISLTYCYLDISFGGGQYEISKFNYIIDNNDNIIKDKVTSGEVIVFADDLEKLFFRNRTAIINTAKMPHYQIENFGKYDEL